MNAVDRELMADEQELAKQIEEFENKFDEAMDDDLNTADALSAIFELVKDEDSTSGYLWTSKVGVHKPITAGSFCTGSIIVERRPPIEKVFYKLSQWLRNR